MPRSGRSEPLANASPGDKFAYVHPEQKGYGEHHLGEQLTAEMTELDLVNGTEVTLLEYDADTGWPLVQWTDLKGLPRITTINPDNMTMFV